MVINVNGCGVPLGSVWESLPFVKYVNNLDLRATGRISKFRDGTKISGVVSVEGSSQATGC